MTTPDAHPAATEVSIRTPLWGRVWAIGFAIVWSVLLIVFTSRGDDGPLLRVVLPAALILFAAALVWRIVVQGIRSDGDRLAVRRAWSTTWIDRSDVRSVTVGSAPQTPGSSCVVVSTATTTVIAPPLTTLPFGRHAREQAERQAQTVREWAGVS